jgi:hypothetical protein
VTFASFLLPRGSGLKYIPPVSIPDYDRHLRWSRLSEQIFRVDKWSVCRG